MWSRLFAVCLLVTGDAFHFPRTGTLRNVRRLKDFHVSGGEPPEDPTKVWYAEIANVVQNVLTNSPLNEGKKAFVKILAGSYDEAATRAKLLGLVEEEAVLMLSFTK